jgi:hypothetical protein
MHSAHSVVYWFPHRGEGGRDEAAAVYACARGHRAVRLHEFLWGGYGIACPLGDHECELRDDWRRRVALAGMMLAYETDSGEDTKYSNCHCERWGITVVSLSSGRVIHRAWTGPHRGNVDEPGAPGQEYPTEHGDLYVGVGPAEQLAVKPNGSVAWIAWNLVAGLEAFRAGRDHELPIYELRVIDQSGERLIAAGSTLDPHALAFRGNRLEYDIRSFTVVH